MPEPDPTSIFACLPKTTRGMPIVLGGDPKGKNFLYTNGNSVIIRDINNPEICDMYTEHSQPTTVAKYSPSGFYIASGDTSGKIRIWDTTQKEHLLKNEFQPFAGVIKDIAWTGDSQRIMAAGEGREKFGHVFMAETGTSVGEIMGHSKCINSCDFRPDRPMRLVTAGEDNNVVFFQGPPFRFDKSIKDHQRFVNCVRYHPKGDVFITGGAEGKALIFDGKTAEARGELGAPAHKGGIYGLSFSDDGSKVLTVSGDKTAKIWDVGTAAVVTEFPMGTTVEDMQVGCLWQGPHVLSVSLSGHINYLDQNNPTSPLRVLHGHNKPITAMTVMNDKTTAFTGSSDGIICSWNLGTGVTQTMRGKGHTSQVMDLACCGDDTLISCGMDDNLIFSSTTNKEYSDTLKMPSQPRAVAVGKSGLVIVACINDIVVLQNRQPVHTFHVDDFEPVSVALHPGETEFAVGSGTDNNVHLYTLSECTVSFMKTLETATGNVAALSYSPDGAYLATGDSNRKVVLYQLPGYESLSKTGYSLHQARINCMAWSADSTRFATGALDTNILAWSPSDIMNPAKVKSAHPLSQVSRVAFLDTNRLVTAGHDSSIRQWTV